MSDKYTLLGVLSHEKLFELGFKKDDDGSEDPRGITWHYKTTHFEIMIDAYCEVYLTRINPDTDQIQIVVDDVFELECLVDWVED